MRFRPFPSHAARISNAISTLCLRAVLVVLTMVPLAGGTAGATQAISKAENAVVDALADEQLKHLRATSEYVRMLSGLPVTELRAYTPERAAEEAAFASRMLARLQRIHLDELAPQQWLLAQMLRDTWTTAANASQDYWLEFTVTPYNGGQYLSAIHLILESQAVESAEARLNYLHLVDDYVGLIDQLTAKTTGQAARGIRVPQPAIPGVRTTFEKLKSGSREALLVSPQRLAGVSAEEAARFRDAIDKRVEDRVQPAYDRLLAVFDTDYRTQAPVGVGLSQYPGGKEFYQRLIRYQTGFTLTPREIHDRGLEAGKAIDREMKEIRDLVGFEGTREEFHRSLRTPRFLAETPADVERRYLEHIARIEPHIPRYFATLPQARYGVQRLDVATEAGLTYGYYQPPSAAEPVGLYRYNGSELDKRSMVTAAHLVYHELIPGHHFHIALQTERARRQETHPVREFLFYGAFNEGWAEYSASLAREMGALEDPYDRYGDLAIRSIVAARLVVDTGMNYFGWSLEQAREYMKAHTLESEVQIASETLRYSTDMFAQALGYRLGYEKFWELRGRAERALGKRFDVRTFHAAAIGEGAMPLNVLDAHIDRYIRAELEKQTPRGSR